MRERQEGFNVNGDLLLSSDQSNDEARVNVSITTYNGIHVNISIIIEGESKLEDENDDELMACSLLLACTVSTMKRRERLGRLDMIIVSAFNIVRRLRCHTDETLIERLLMFREYRLNQLVIEFLCAECHRQIEIEKEDALDEPIDRKVADNRFGEEVDRTQQRKHHPIGEPLSVVRLRCRLDSTYRYVCRIEKADKVAYEFGEMTEHEVECL